MRLWDYRLIEVLPKQMLVSQWRECIAIKRQWEKGTLKHRLVSYVMDYNTDVFYYYFTFIWDELVYRNIKFNKKFVGEMYQFSSFCNKSSKKIFNYPEHDDKYLRQCLYNLEEKAIRGIITKEEWKPIYEKFNDKFDLWDGK